MKVLIAVDGSEGSWEALRLAGNILGAQDDLLLYYSPPAPRSASASKDVASSVRQSLFDAVANEAAARLPETLRPRIRPIVGTRSPHQGVLACAEEERCDLIVMGARGVGRIASLVLGSVSRAVVHHAKIPVLVARPRPQEASADAFSVVVAYSAPEEMQELVDLVNRLQWTPQTVGKLVHVIQPMFVGQLPPWLEKMARDSTAELLADAWIKEHDEEKASWAKKLAEVAATLPSAFRGTPIVAEGFASEQIIATARQQRADLVVMGARGVAAWERFFVGSTSEKVLAGAGRSVLVVRHPARS